ncbi:hypothetical protein COT20_01835 [bacterium (Candidatus Gribaldobacteria) CG08_land_8_20_14_0_20_39_15]|uniref:HicB family protein n=1 Tax=bacterium (Candidatus Gribaldobacteria) CG08_land_8_20_14_0_20_39_15 TaxID=2014273 RepID=A0A2M6XUC4_9BACT|nr:MAG: hypothetical protein COT20_01835 [bacterium (Candidatus Gribaldobacteria) CG08_land_8_20_14_0_20_39_15]
MKKVKFPFPVFTIKEGRWFVSECPVLGIATQGRTEKEVRKNMIDLIKEYLADPDTPKGQMQELASSSLSYISVPVASELLYGQT